MKSIQKPPQIDTKLVDATLDDHRETMRAVSTIEAQLDRGPGANGDWVLGLLEELPRLCETLRCHFSEEQEGPLYRSLPVTHPRLATRLAKLEAEHSTVLAAIEEAIRRGRELSDPQLYEMREYNAQLQLLIARIRRHEAEENEIILEAHWDEVGTGD